MLVKAYCAAVNGLEVTTVTVEVSLNKGVMYHLTGLGDEAVRESRDRIAAALQYSGFKFPIADITINLAPANLRKEGSSFDLPLAIGIMGANGNIPEEHLKEYMMVGELSLDGTLQPIKGALPIAIRARAEHFKGLIVPEQNAREAAVVNNLVVYGMKNLFDEVYRMGTNEDEHQLYYLRQCCDDVLDAYGAPETLSGYRYAERMLLYALYADKPQQIGSLQQYVAAEEGIEIGTVTSALNRMSAAMAKRGEEPYRTLCLRSGRPADGVLSNGQLFKGLLKDLRDKTEQYL